MHNLFAGLMGIFMGLGGMFHHGVPPHTTTTTQANLSGTPEASVSGMPRRDYRKQGERPFFGTVTTVNGSTITVQMLGRVMMFREEKNSPEPSSTPSAAPAKTITVHLDSTTKYTGGSQSDITNNTRIAGIGKVNTDNTLTAISIQINPAIPSGFPSGMPMFREKADRGFGNGFRPGNHKQNQ